jgi:hypothetical protein
MRGTFFSPSLSLPIPCGRVIDGCQSDKEIFSSPFYALSFSLFHFLFIYILLLSHSPSPSPLQLVVILLFLVNGSFILFTRAHLLQNPVKSYKGNMYITHHLEVYCADF